MSLPEPTPKLPSWIFFVADAAFLAAAWLIFERSPRPLPLETSFLIVGCVFAGALVALVPLVARYERKKNEVLDERQRSLESLSRTIASSAEQISIAANGFHEITELAHKNLKQAEQLPHKLQDKIAEFNAQLDNAREDDREELEKEVAELRTAESERLATLADKIHKAVAELARLDAAAQKNLTARTELVHRAETAATRLPADASAAIADSLAIFTRELTAAEAKTLAAIDAKLAERTAAVIAAIESAAAQAVASFSSGTPTPAPSAAPEQTSPPASIDVASPPKRPRKARRDESVGPEETPVAMPAPNPADAELATQPNDEPPPVPTESISAIEPVAPPSADPFPAPPDPADSDPVETLSPATAAPTAPPPTERPPRKRTPRKPEPEPAPSLSLPLDDDNPRAESPGESSDDTPVTAGDAVERVLSSDGATRLIATAYIGIGNRLFIRGDGPGLSWEKGMPLQFVSIGKWRWETADASAPIRFKLYKNDDIECATLGELTLDPGHQQEVTARF